MQDVLLGLDAGPAMTHCGHCDALTDATAMVTRVSLAKGKDPTQGLVCYSCFYNPNGSQPVAKAREIPKPVDPRSFLACSSYRSLEAASGRQAKVAETLGTIPSIYPDDPNAKVFTVVGDSKLVPGFVKAPNPYA